MDNVKIDWIMVTYGGVFHGVKKNKKPHHAIMTIEELKDNVLFLMSEKLLEYPLDYLLTDTLYLKEGVFKWEHGGYNKVANKYDSITAPKPITKFERWLFEVLDEMEDE